MSDYKLERPVMCVNHPQRKATHLKDSYFVYGSPYPICDVCTEKIKKYFPKTYKNMNIRPISSTRRIK